MITNQDPKVRDKLHGDGKKCDFLVFSKKEIAQLLKKKNITPNFSDACVLFSWVYAYGHTVIVIF